MAEKILSGPVSAGALPSESKAEALDLGAVKTRSHEPVARYTLAFEQEARRVGKSGQGIAAEGHSHGVADRDAPQLGQGQSRGATQRG